MDQQEDQQRDQHDDRNRRDHPAEQVSKHRLASRFRSSQTFAAPSDANFGIKGTLALYDSSAALNPKFATALAARCVRTSGSRHWARTFVRATPEGSPPVLSYCLTVISVPKMRPDGVGLCAMPLLSPYSM